MGDVYSRANQVISYMGDDDSEEPTFDDVAWLHTTLLDKITKYAESNGALTRQDFIPMNTPANDGLHASKIDTTIPWASLRSLFRFYGFRRYLSRAWIIQELCLAKNEPLILLGDQTITFDSLCRLQITLAGHPIVQNMFHRASDGNTGVGSEIIFLYALREKLRGLSDETFGYFADDLFGVDRRSRATAKAAHFAVWEEVLCTVFQRRATDPRDQMYSIVGLVNSFAGSAYRQDLIRPDYTASVEKVYEDFTAQLITHTPNHHVLSLASMTFDGPDDIRARMPSWVPDYMSCRNQIEGIQIVYMRKTGNVVDFSPAEPAASNLTKRQRFLRTLSRGADLLTKKAERSSQLRVDGHELVVRARYGGRVVKVSKIIEEQDWNSEAPVLARPVQMMVRVLLSAFNACTGYSEIYRPTAHSTIEVVFRLLSDLPHGTEDTQSVQQKIHDTLCDAIAESHATGLSPSPELDDLKMCLSKVDGQNGIPSPNELASFQRAGETVHKHGLGLGLAPYFTEAERQKLTNAAHNALSMYGAYVYSLFFTTDGYLGKTAAAVKDEDDMWLFSGARVPFLLRSTEKGKYRLVGEGMVYGAMHGEMVRKGIASAVKEIRIV